MPFMTKELSKEIMLRSRLRNKFLLDKTDENRFLYTQQRNKCVALLRKTKTTYYENLDEKNVTDNKKFWKTVKPYLSDKSVKCDKINLNENGELLKSESETAEVFNNFFSNIVKNIKIPEYKNLNTNIENVKDPFLRAILKYKNHPSIIAIKEKSKNEKFSFHEVNNKKIERGLMRLNKNKASQKYCETVNCTIKTSNFPSCLKLADITPLHEKGRKDNKENYRPVGILPTLSKIFERILFEQISGFFDNFLSEKQCGFRK